MVAVALEALAQETGGELFGDSVTLGKLVIDSREGSEGDLFLCRVQLPQPEEAHAKQVVKSRFALPPVDRNDQAAPQAYKAPVGHDNYNRDLPFRYVVMLQRQSQSRHGNRENQDQ